MTEMARNEKLSHMGDIVHAFHGAGLADHFSETVRRRFKKGPTVTLSIFSIALLIGAFISTQWIDITSVTGDSFRRAWSYTISVKSRNENFKYALNCSDGNMTKTCPIDRPPTFEPSDPSTETCPEYFRWIYEDLKPWKGTGITKEMVERAKTPGHIRVVVVDGRVYMEKFKWVYQTRDMFTVWGILQLLRMYPGKLPDLDLVFECGDRPVLMKGHYQGPNATAPPPLFHYCGDDQTFDIVFPDWSFWGWPEIRIKPWDILKNEIKEGNNRTKWMDREPYAFWKGNIKLGVARQELSKCIKTNEQDWNARIYNMDWSHEMLNKFKSSDLASQCTHKYKIYVEGAAWSVSEKYILACDSVTLLVIPQYYDFFTRSLRPMVHYWPIKQNGMCQSIKFATEWCNNNTKKAQEIGKAGSRFVQEELKMKFVYDYMFHLLSAYGKLFKYKPTVPAEAVEVCAETMTCTEKGLQKKFKIKSTVNSPSNTGPCTMPPPFDPEDIKTLLERNDHVIKQVEKREVTIGSFGEGIDGCCK